MKYSILTLKEKNITNFAKARNRLLSTADTEWVLFLDSDEFISPALKKEIDSINNPKYNGYLINRQGIVEEQLLRLARKNSGKWQRRVHEVWNVKGKVGKLKNPIIHNDNLPVLDLVKKINYYSTLHARANYEEGKSANLFKIIFFPKYKFFQTYILKKAYQKGLNGFVFSLMQAFQCYLSWSKLYFLSF
jgi:glycosyltransferase involved in cell wall biosynthesis